MNRRAVGNRLLALVALVLASCGEPGRVAGGTNDETHTEWAARFFQPGGERAAVDAVVQVVPHNGTLVAAAGRTDSLGRPVVAPLPDGLYTVSVSQNGQVVFVDSVPASKGRLVLTADDTLAPAGTLSGVVAMQPNHDPATTTVNVLGTDIHANVSTDGTFRLEGLGAGRFRLRFVTTENHYTPTYVLAAAASGAAAVLPDTVRMVYTGIPVVTGIVATNDTLTGDQILSWRAARHKDLLDYVVYRDTIDALSPSRNRYATSSDTVWRDTAASRGTRVAKWKYRIVVETMTGDTGAWYGHAVGTSVPRAVSRLDRGAWTQVGRSSGGALADLGGALTEIVTSVEGANLVVGVRTSADGLLWDSSGIALARKTSGQDIQWMIGVGAGKVWCLGHSSLGDGIDVRSSLDGRTWTTSNLPDSLWPAGGASLSWIGSAAKAAVAGPDGAALVLADGVWAKARFPSPLLGATDSVLYTTGGGTHVLSVSWTNRSDIRRDFGTPPFGTPSQVVSFQGTLAALAQGRLWILDPSGWTLRRPTGLNRIASFGDRLLASDTTGRLQIFTEMP